MIETITLNNFKAFQCLDSLNIKPITILCGTNSCGKSSILQSLLLLKQTLESQNLNQTILLNGRLVHLGSFENILYQKDSANCVKFQFTFKIKRSEGYNENNQTRRSLPFWAIMRELVPREGDHASEYIFRFSVGLLLDRSKSQYLKGVSVDSFSIEVEAKQDTLVMPGASIHMQKSNTSYDIEWKNLRNRFPFSSGDKETNGKTSIDVQFNNLFPLFPRTLGLTEKFHPDFSFTISRFRDLLEQIFSSYTYLGPLREEPSRRYIYEDEILEIGSKGENAAYIYLNEKRRKISYYAYDSDREEFIRNDKKNLGDGVKEWLDFMDIKGFEPEPQNEIIYLNLDANTATKTRVSIADVGFGVSQIFPIILEGLRMSPESTLLLEQPEIHLHPNLQMHMADYFIALALSNKRVIVETHSDHIVNRLVRRIVEDDTGKIKDLINIYFIKPSETGSQYESVHIDANRGIVNWPVDFFDQTAIEQEKIIQAGIRKRRNKKINKES